jgi:hypothetical protein
MPRDLPAIEAFLASNSFRPFFLRFPPPLEGRFNQETAQAQIQSLTQMGITGILLFNVFLFTDFILVPNHLLSPSSLAA